MDSKSKVWHFSDMMQKQSKPAAPMQDMALPPSWSLYGEAQAFPDVLHIERIIDRAAGLDWKIAPHRHSHLHQLFLIHSGTVDFSADGRKMQLQPPFLLSIPAGVIHGFSFSAGTEGQVLTLPLPNLPDILGPTSPFAAKLSRVAAIAADSVIYQMFSDIQREHVDKLPGRSVALRAIAAQIICAAMRALPDPQEGSDAAPDPRFAMFQNLLSRHLKEGWSVGDYAREIGVSERHLSRICRKAIAQPAAKYIESAVMQEACRLLVYTRMSVGLVGYQLGFDDPSYFSRAFKRAMGRGPQEYRAGFDAA